MQTEASFEPIPILDLKKQTRLLEKDITAAIRDVLDSASFILGPAVQALEDEMTKYSGCLHAVSVASGTDALRLAFAALDVGQGDEVITTPFSFVATANTIVRCGATPVFVDIDPETYNIDSSKIEAVITARTKAILPVHLYGQPADMRPICSLAKVHRLHVIEDCAQAIGARYNGSMVGSFGDAGCLSFFPTKNLGAFGDGGMVLTNDSKIAGNLDLLRRQGSRQKYKAEVLGFNSRLDTLQASILGVKLGHLEDWNSSRRAIAYRYNKWLEGEPVKTPSESSLVRHVYHLYTIRAPRRDDLAAFLTDQGIGNAVYYPVPLHLQKAFSGWGYAEGSFPVSEIASREVISLPMFPELTQQQQIRVCKAVSNFYRI